MAAKGGGSVDLCGINIRTSPHSTEASATSRTILVHRLKQKVEIRKDQSQLKFKS